MWGVGAMRVDLRAAMMSRSTALALVLALGGCAVHAAPSRHALPFLSTTKTERVYRDGYAHGVCDHARDARLLQPGRYDDCVRAVTADPQDR